MINLDIQGQLGKFGYHNIPKEVADSILRIATLKAYEMAVRRAPYDPTPDGIHLKTDLEHEYIDEELMGVVSIESPYAMITERGSRHRLAHPFMRPAADAARRAVKSLIIKSVKEAIAEEKLKSGGS